MHAIAETPAQAMLRESLASTDARIQEEDSDPPVGIMDDASGEVEVSIGKQMTQAVSRGALLRNDTTISTGEKSMAVLKFIDGQVIALQANTSFRILDYRYNPKEVEKSNLFFYMLKGGLRAITGLIGHERPAAFRMETQETTVGIRGTDFMVALEDKLYMQCTSGSIDVKNKAGSIELKTGQAVAVASPTTMPVLIKADDLPKGIFLKLKSISVPDTKPIEIKKPSKPSVTPVSAQTDTQKEKEKKEASKGRDTTFSCDKFGWEPGSQEYKDCITYAKVMGVIKK